MAKDAQFYMQGLGVDDVGIVENYKEQHVRSTPSGATRRTVPGCPWAFAEALPGPADDRCTCQVPGAVLVALCPAGGPAGAALGALPPPLCGHCCPYCAEACRG